MIPILYDKNETDFTHNGIGFLSKTIKATVTEERNGSYELSLQYPISGIWYEQITRGSIIKAKANDTSAPQLFRVYKASRPLSGIVTYSAEHISYALNGIPTCGLSVKNVTSQAAINKAIEGASLPCPFTALSDISTLNSTEIKEPCSVRAILGGQRGSILDVWGGEYEFDNFVVRLHNHRGADNGVTIEYGKNLTDLTQEENISECYTHLMPYATISQNGADGDVTYIYLSEKVLPLIEAEDIGHSKAYIMDFTDRFGDDEDITEKALREKAKAYISTADLGVPKVSISVSFVPLWQTEEYKNIAPLERVSLCDTVRVYFSKLGVTATAKVNKTVYDVLNERYDNIYIGDAKSSFADTVNKTNSAIEDVKESVKTGQAKAAETLQKEIERATNAITGYSGGYIRLNPPENPQELLVLDKPTIEEALNVWRLNLGGFGHSSTGYNGKYGTAITMDGHINADFLTVGTITGVDIRGVHIYGTTIEGSTINAGTINGAEIVGGLIKGPRLEVDNARIGGFDIDDGNIVYQGGLIADYNGSNRHFRTIIKPAHFDVNAGTAAYSWTLSTQTIREEDYELGTKDEYSPTFILYADGIVETYRNIYLAERMGLRSGKRMRYNETVDTSINLIGYNPNDRYLIIGSGSQQGGTRIFCQENSAISCCFGEGGSGRSFSFERTDTNFGENIDGSPANYVKRYVMNTAGGCVISANDGSNALILNASNVHVVNALRVWDDFYVKYATYLLGRLTVDGIATFKDNLTVNGIATLNDDLIVKGDTTLKSDLTVSGSATINNVSIALESIGFSNAGIAADNRRVMRTNTALVISANSGNNALYLQASTTHIINGLTVYGTATLKSNLTVNGNITVNGNVNGITTTYESIGWTNIGVSAASRRVMRSSGALVMSANDGANAMYLDASTTYIIKNLTIGGTAKFSSGSAITSDARLKNSIAPLIEDSRYVKLYNLLKPVTHKYNDGQSGRTHIGFIAQDLKEALEAAGFTTDEIAAYVEFASDKEGLDGYEGAIRYTEFIPYNTAMIQMCLALIAELWQEKYNEKLTF